MDFTARRLTQQVQAVFSGEHEYRKVTPREFPWVDLKFYQETQKSLENLGFVFVTDIEDLNLSKQLPHLRTFTRAMAGDSGVIRVEFFNIRPVGMKMFILRLLGAVPASLTTRSAWTEFDDGTYLNTTNSPPKYSLSSPTEINRVRLPADVSIENQVGTHRERVKDYLDSHTGASSILVNSHDEIVAQMNRILVVLAKHRKLLSGLTRSELDNIASPGQKESAQKLYEALEKERFNPNSGE